VAGVRRGFLGISTTESHDQRATQRQGDPLEGVEIRVGDATLDPTDDHATEIRRALRAGCASIRGACACAWPGSRPNPGLLFAHATVDFDRQLGSSDAGHDRHMSFAALYWQLAAALRGMTGE